MNPYAQTVWQQATILLLAPIPIIFIAYFVDSRTLNDIAIWTKPLKFHVSAAIHLATFAFIAAVLPVKQQIAKWLIAVAFVSTAATLFEVYLIDMQAMRGVHSHFNYSTQSDIKIYQMMGVAAVVLSLPALILGLVCWFLPTSNTLTPGLKLGAALGLTFGFILTLLIAGYMSSLPTGHWVNAPTTDSGGLPIVGWTHLGGDLRVPHFFATHIMQVLPLFGWVLDKTFKNQKKKVLMLVTTASIVWISITLGTLFQALKGQPFIS
jgi:hypothetical protein